MRAYVSLNKIYKLKKIDKMIGFYSHFINSIIQEHNF